MNRIKIYEEDTSLRELLSLCLQLKDYQAEKMTGIASSGCPCTSDNVCASALIVSTKCPDICMTLLDEQEKNGCKIPKQNKVILSADFSEGQREVFEKEGYSTIAKPYKFADVSKWLDSISLHPQNASNNTPVQREALAGCLGGGHHCDRKCS